MTRLVRRLFIVFDEGDDEVRPLRIAGIVLIALGIVSMLLGLAVVGSSYYLCPIWASSTSGCLQLAGPPVSSPPNSLYWGQWPSFVTIVLLASGIVVIVVSVRNLPMANRVRRTDSSSASDG